MIVFLIDGSGRERTIYSTPMSYHAVGDQAVALAEGIARLLPGPSCRPRIHPSFTATGRAAQTDRDGELDGHWYRSRQTSGSRGQSSAPGAVFRWMARAECGTIEESSQRSTATRPWRGGMAGLLQWRSTNSRPNRRLPKPGKCSLRIAQSFIRPSWRTQAASFPMAIMSETCPGLCSIRLREKFSGVTMAGSRPRISSGRLAAAWRGLTRMSLHAYCLNRYEKASLHHSSQPSWR